MATDRPRILWILPSLEVGGTERQAALLLPYLSRTFEPRVLTLYREGPLAEDLKQSGIPVFCLDGRSLYDLTLSRKLQSFVKDYNYDGDRSASNIVDSSQP